MVFILSVTGLSVSAEKTYPKHSAITFKTGTNIFYLYLYQQLSRETQNWSRKIEFDRSFSVNSSKVAKIVISFSPNANKYARSVATNHHNNTLF